MRPQDSADVTSDGGLLSFKTTSLDGDGIDQGGGVGSGNPHSMRAEGGGTSERGAIWNYVRRRKDISSVMGVVSRIVEGRIGLGLFGSSSDCVFSQHTE